MLARRVSYDCFFQGINGTNLIIQNIGQLLAATETLECYGLQQCSDYPNAPVTAMTAIDVKTGGIDVSPTWVAENRVADCGQNTTIVSSVAGNGEVDIHYPWPPWHTQFNRDAG